MTGPPPLQIAVLAAAAAAAIGMAAVAFSRRQLPGSRAFGWLTLAVALWCAVSALHSLPQAIESQLRLTKLQYIGIAALPPLWLLFAADYVGVRWLARPVVRRAIWILPIVELLIVLANDWHQLYFTSVDRPAGVTVYHWGPLFWAAAAHNYTLMAAGTLILLRGLKLFAREYRGQTAVLAGAAIVPWLGNAAYLAGILRPGFDPTPVLFAVSMALFFWGLYAYQLFDVVPMARAAVFERFGDAVFVLDRAGRVVDANASAITLAGLGGRRHALADVLGRKPVDLLPWWSGMPAAPAADDAEPTYVEDGNRILKVRSEDFVDSRGAGGSLLWVRDVTAMRQAEVERAALEKKLHEQRRIESLAVMAAGLAHDFNNLLTAMLGNADYIAATTAEGTEQRASAEAIATAAQHAADLVTQMVAFSGQGRTFIGPISVEDAVSDVIRALSRTLGERAMITHESELDLPRLAGDVVQIRQAVLALLTNAVDAAEDRHGPVEVVTGQESLDEAALAAMTYSAAEPGLFIFVDVKDEGAGMPADVLQRVFEPFFSTRDLGRGLGLAAVHGIVRSHRGAIRFWSAPGQGTRVRVWFPLS